MAMEINLLKILFPIQNGDFPASYLSFPGPGTPKKEPDQF